MKQRLSSLLVILLSISVLPSCAYAARESRSLPVDYRVHTVPYQRDAVFKFIGHYGYQSSIEFGADETIKTISMGDSTAWMMNPSGNRLFLKPVEQNATTNMTLFTDKRTYLFELHAREASGIADPDMIFVMRFAYADNDVGGGPSGSYLDGVPDSETIASNPNKYNTSYTISGSDEVAPLKIFDDGEFTFFQFADKNAEVPAFYLVNDLGDEAMINYRTRGDYIVVERVASRYTLRRGSEIVCVFNEKRIADRERKKKE